MRMLCLAPVLIFSGCVVAPRKVSIMPIDFIAQPAVRAAVTISAAPIQPESTNQWYQTQYGYLEQLPYMILYFDGNRNLVCVNNTFLNASRESMSLYHSYDMRTWQPINISFNITWGTNVIPYVAQFNSPMEFFKLVDY